MSVISAPAPDLIERGDSETLARLGSAANQLSREILDVLSALTSIETTAGDQTRRVGLAMNGASGVAHANAAVLAASQSLAATVAGNRRSVDSAVDQVRTSGSEVRTIAVWVQDLDRRMAGVEDALELMQSSTLAIRDIAAQVNILSINAKIEAARAGDAGRGFAVVAEAIKGLSARTAAVAGQIGGNITELSGGILAIRTEAESVARRSDAVIGIADRADAALADVAQGISTTESAAGGISASAAAVAEAGLAFGPSFLAIAEGISRTAENVRSSREKVDGLIAAAEVSVQCAVLLGADTEDLPMIHAVRSDAAEVALRFEEAVRIDQITSADLFDDRYQDIPGTDPPQMLSRFTLLADRVLPDILERALSRSPQVVCCSAIDRNGYTPTHNRKFSHPQGPDPVWNAAHCRNRRMFNDRAGLKAAESTGPFLLQVYRRDMGGGSFSIMKDLSAPIIVNGRHWGALRLAYAR